ncbi:MAG TPA: helix-turn-helix domain-containing protein, partial [Chitinophagaceae bacterium]|nr:helix-turn-helix domain-containing protein [Chitinophagaceae bacterium]
DFGPYVFSAVVFFQAGGFFRLTGMPLNALLDREEDAGLFFGEELYQLEQRLKEAFDPQEIGRHIELFLRKRMARAADLLPIDHAINSLVKSHGNLPIERAAALACLSTRQFERKCQERLGLNPKLFARLIRFTKVYTIKESRPEFKWTQIAYDLGYHDQMHLIRDFKTFAGFAPSVMEKITDSSFQLINILEPGL